MSRIPPKVLPSIRNASPIGRRSKFGGYTTGVATDNAVEGKSGDHQDSASHQEKHPDESNAQNNSARVQHAGTNAHSVHRGMVGGAAPVSRSLPVGSLERQKLTEKPSGIDRQMTQTSLTHRTYGTALQRTVDSERARFPGISISVGGRYPS